MIIYAITPKDKTIKEVYIGKTKTSNQGNTLINHLVSIAIKRNICG